MGKKHSKDSSQDSLGFDLSQPPLKKHKQQHDQEASIFSTQELSMSSSQRRTSVIIRKGDKMQKRITNLLRLIDEGQEVFLMSSGEGIQKLLSIIEIFKLKLLEKEGPSGGKFEQFNKLDKYETVNKKNEILEKKIKVPVFYSLIRRIGDGDGDENGNDDEFAEWTRQTVE